MAHSTETAHLKLSIFEGEDRPSILQDTNSDHMKIDKFASDVEAELTVQKMVNEGEAATLQLVNTQLINLANELTTLKNRIANDEVQISQNATAIANLQKQISELLNKEQD